MVDDRIMQRVNALVERAQKTAAATNKASALDMHTLAEIMKDLRDDVMLLVLKGQLCASAFYEVMPADHSKQSLSEATHNLRNGVLKEFAKYNRSLEKIGDTL
jgi:hypothetical protein